ncbi:MAG: hypothetical protein ACRBDI_09030 [Alphaproteobacteria bacterium]
MFSLNDKNITLPYLELTQAISEDRALYLRFMGHLRHVPVSRAEIKILSSIQFTADMTDNSDAYIASVLVEMGLRAPRLAFPNSFLDFADRTLMRRDWDVGAPSDGLMALQEYWFNQISSHEKPSGDFRQLHSVVREDVLV